MRNRLIVLWLSASILAISNAAADVSRCTNADATRQRTAAQIIKKALEVNSVWLDPPPVRLHYVVTGKVEKPGGVEMTNTVWLDGDKARWEMESQTLPPREPAYHHFYTLVINSGEEMYLRAPSEKLLGQRKPARRAYLLRAGISFSTAMHALQQHGVPQDCRIVETRTTDAGEVVVLQMDLQPHGAWLGLGLFHLQLGNQGKRLGEVRLHLQLPDHVPILEELVGQDARFEYDPDFLAFEQLRAPRVVKLVSKSPGVRGIGGIDEWVLEAHFKTTEGLWLFDQAVNRQDGKVVCRVKLKDASRAPFDERLFDLPPVAPPRSNRADQPNDE